MSDYATSDSELSALGATPPHPRHPINDGSINVPDELLHEGPILPPAAPPLRLTTASSLPRTSSVLFTRNLYSRTLQPGHPPRVLFACLQPQCSYAAPPQPLNNTTTGNLWKHYHARHLKLYILHRSGIRSSAASSEPPSSPTSTATATARATFFEPRLDISRLTEEGFRRRLLACVLDNALAFSLVESSTFKGMIEYISPTTKIVSRWTLRRDLELVFNQQKEVFKAEIFDHIQNGGRLCLTTDSWAARNYKKYAAITIHWVNIDWSMKSAIIDVVHLTEPIHSGEYLARIIFAATEDFGITKAVFTITRDNASNNTVMLKHFETAASAYYSSLHPWPFKASEGDVRCIAHIINLAVQVTLKTLKAQPSDDVNSYHFEEECARIPTQLEPDSTIADCLAKLRRHIYVFKNREAWRDALKRQVDIAGIPAVELELDMPVRWSSTHEMLVAALCLREHITAHCSSQTLDLSMRRIQLTDNDWATLEELERLFQIFVKPTQQMQGETYPTLGAVIPWYMRMINKLRAKIADEATLPAIEAACKAAIMKLDEYHTSAANQTLSHSNVATILDPRMNIHAFKGLFPNSRDQPRINRAKAQFKHAFSLYATRHRELERAALEEVDLDAEIQVPDSDDEMYGIYTGSTESEENRWLNEKQASRPTNVLDYWKLKQAEYPVMAQMARDYLAIPATSAPSERVFSQGSDLLTKKRNHMAPDTLRYQLCLKSWGLEKLFD